MEMTACNACGKIFGSTGRSICPACRKKLDEIYDKARTYIRDNPKAELKADTLTEAIGAEVKYVEILVAEGKFDPGKSDEAAMDEDDKKRAKLLEDIQKSLTKMSDKTETAKVVTYGSARHGRE